MLRALAALQINEARRYLLAYFVAKYAPLTEAETAEFRRRTGKSKQEEEMSLIVESAQLTWRQQGLLAGQQIGEQNSILRVLSRRFGGVREEVAAQIRRVQSEDALNDLLDQSVTIAHTEDRVVPGAASSEPVE